MENRFYADRVLIYMVLYAQTRPCLSIKRLLKVILFVPWIDQIQYVMPMLGGKLEDNINKKPCDRPIRRVSATFSQNRIGAVKM